MVRLKGLAFLAGLALLAYAVRSAGFASVISPLLKMRWWFLLALLSTLSAQLLRTLAWSLVLGSHTDRVSFVTLWRIRLIGEAFSYLSVAGPFLGDPAKAWLLSPDTGGKRAAASVAFDRYLYSVSGVLFLILAVIWWLPRGGTPLLLLGAIAAAMSPVWLARYSRQLSLTRMYAVLGVHLLSHLFMVLEVGIIFRALGINATLFQVLSVEVVTKGMNALFFFVPMQMGVIEGGYTVLLQQLNMGATLGLTVGLARRLRSLFWSGWGLALLWKSGHLGKADLRLGNHWFTVKRSPQD